MNNSIRKAVGIFSLSAALLPAALYADTSDSWEFGASIYGWFPDISGSTAFPHGGGGDFTVPVGDILDKLQFTFQGSFDARKGSWGFITDVIYMDMGETKTGFNEGTIGGSGIPADVTGAVGFDMKSWIWTTAGYYRLVDQPQAAFDLLAGLRYTDVEQSLHWSFSGDIGQLPLPGPEGRAEVSADYWDAIIGVRGRFAFGNDGSWFLPYYFDVGTGDSDFTWQAVAGLGYAFGWGDVAAVWRYLDYDLPSGKPIGDMDFSGPAIGAVFRW